MKKKFCSNFFIDFGNIKSTIGTVYMANCNIILPIRKIIGKEFI